MGQTLTCKDRAVRLITCIVSGDKSSEWVDIFRGKLKHNNRFITLFAKLVEDSPGKNTA